MRGIMLIAILLCLSFAARAQTRAIDSIRYLIYHAPDKPTQKQCLIGALRLQRSVNLDTLRAYVRQATALGPFTVAEALQLNIAGVYYYMRAGRADSALRIVERDLQWLYRNKGHDDLVMLHELLHGGILLRRNDHKQALDKFFIALGLAEKHKVAGAQIRALNGIGWVYMELLQYDDAIKWFRKALAVPGRLLPGNNFCPVYSNLASCFGALGIADSAHYYAEQAIAFSRQYEDLTSEANSLVIKADIVLEEGRFAEAITLLKQTIALRKSLNDPFYILSDLCILANIYARTGNTELGLQAAAEAMAIARQYNIIAKLPMIYTSFETNYAARNDYRQLARIYEEHLAIKDSVYRNALAEELAEKEARYGAEKREREIARQSLVIQHERDSRKVAIFSLSGIILLIGAAGMVYLQRSSASRQKKEFGAIVEAEQKERIRIARDLHDSIGQMLSVVKMKVSNIHYQATGAEKEQTAGTLTIVDQTIQELRHISHNLIPEELSFGIGSALEELSRKINEAGQTRIDLDVSDDLGGRKFNKQFELSLYRIIQEIVSNMLKHAQATEIRVSLKQKDNQVQLIVRDNGIGFDTAMIKQSKGLGWKNVTGRVSLLNGKMQVQSEKIKGTQIEITLPV